jgi:hypothetical protein
MSIKVRQRGNVLRIDLPMFEEPLESASGKSMVVASTRGVIKTGVRLQDRDVHFVASAFIYKRTKASKLRHRPEDSEDPGN